MRKLCLLIIFILAGCKAPIIDYYRKDVQHLKRINIKKLDQYFEGKHEIGEELLSFSDEQFYLKKRIGSTISLLHAVRKNKTILSLDINEYYSYTLKTKEYYSDGRLKYEVNSYLQRQINVTGIGLVGVAQYKFGVSKYYDQNGNSIEEVNYDSIFKFTMQDVISVIKKDNEIKGGNSSVGRSYFSTKIDSEFNLASIRELNKSGVAVMANHPYWNINKTVPSQQSTSSNYTETWIDGANGNIVGTKAYPIITKI